MAGLVPNGSLGEYEALTEEERGAMVMTGHGQCGEHWSTVVPGRVRQIGRREARSWAEQAAEAGAAGP